VLGNQSEHCGIGQVTLTKWPSTARSPPASRSRPSGSLRPNGSTLLCLGVEASRDPRRSPNPTAVATRANDGGVGGRARDLVNGGLVVASWMADGSQCANAHRQPRRPPNGRWQPMWRRAWLVPTADRGPIGDPRETTCRQPADSSRATCDEMSSQTLRDKRKCHSLRNRIDCSLRIRGFAEPI
jgi:hypothetical protein